MAKSSTKRAVAQKLRMTGGPFAAFMDKTMEPGPIQWRNKPIDVRRMEEIHPLTVQELLRREIEVAGSDRPETDEERILRAADEVWQSINLPDKLAFATMMKSYLERGNTRAA